MSKKGKILGLLRSVSDEPDFKLMSAPFQKELYKFIKKDLENLEKWSLPKHIKLTLEGVKYYDGEDNLICKFIFNGPDDYVKVWPEKKK